MNKRSWNARSGRSSTNWISKEKRFAIYHRDGFDCVYCRAIFPPAMDGVGLTLDHLIPRSMGGDNRATNLVTACRSCNYSRQNKALASRLLAKLQRLAAQPLNLEAGTILARIFRQCRDRELIHPLTLRVPPHYTPEPSAQLSLDSECF